MTCKKVASKQEGKGHTRGRRAEPTFRIRNVKCGERRSLRDQQVRTDVAATSAVEKI